MLDVERWRMIGGSERIAISNRGRLFSFASMTIMEGIRTPKGYIRVTLPNGRKLVHRLVADTFLPKPKRTQTQINHKNGHKDDNRVVNLEWCTPGENLRHAYNELGRKAATEGKHLSKETKDKIRAANKGRKRSEVCRRKNSESHKGIGLLGANPRAKKTLCLETGEVFSCAKEASIKHGVNYSSVTQSIRNGCLVGGKWHFSHIKGEPN